MWKEIGGETVWVDEFQDTKEEVNKAADAEVKDFREEMRTEIKELREEIEDQDGIGFGDVLWIIFLIYIFK